MKNTQVASKAKSSKRGAYRKQERDDRLSKLGVPKKLVPELLRVARDYEKLAENEQNRKEPTYIEKIRGLRRFKSDATDFLRSLETMPEALRFTVFVMGDKEGNAQGEEGFLDMMRNIQQLVDTCDWCLEWWPNPNKHSHTDHWRRFWIMSVMNRLDALGGWDFDERTWGPGKSYYRLARVIAILNDYVPERVRVTRPDRVVKELMHGLVRK